MADNIQKIQDNLLSILASKGMTLWDLEFKKDGPKWLLRVYIDRENTGITLDDCESVSRDLGTLLDVEDLIKHTYTLEVSSPGLDRSLTRSEHYRKCIGKQIRIKTYQAVNNEKVFRGELKEFRDGQVTILSKDGNEMTFSMNNISKASLEVVI